MEYIDKLTSALKSLENKNSEIEKAGAIIADAIKENRLVHFFGTEMLSCALIPEVFFKAGALTNIDPMLDPTLDPAHGAYRNEMALKVNGLAPCILDYYERVQEGDPFILVGSCAGLPMFTQSLEWAKTRKLKVIAVCCDGDCAKDIEGADVIITNGAEYTDTGAYTVLTAAVLNMIMDAAKKELPTNTLWRGERFVDIEKDKEKIEALLFTIRHL